jgi:hypothetical protein
MDMPAVDMMCHKSVEKSAKLNSVYRVVVYKALRTYVTGILYAYVSFSGQSLAICGGKSGCNFHEHARSTNMAFLLALVAGLAAADGSRCSHTWARSSQTVSESIGQVRSLTPGEKSNFAM